MPMPMPMPVSWQTATAGAVQIDLDGVVRDWGPAVAVAAEQRHRVPTGRIELAAFVAKTMTSAILGQLSDEQWRSRVADALACTYG
jgi:putative hydrolase of the HAD superfamily